MATLKSKGRKITPKKKLLVIGDFPVYTGFGTVLHNLLPHWKNDYELYIMGINYYGDWTPAVAEYRIWPAAQGDDVYGFNKVFTFLSQLQPDLVFILNDPWVAVEYKRGIMKYREQVDTEKKTKFFLYCPVDAPNVKPQYVEPLNDIFDRVITYTEFAKFELIMSGLKIPCDVLPHGVDTNVYKPYDKRTAKLQCGLPEDSFIFLTVSRNQPRKRLDLTMSYFADWVTRENIPANVRWYYHGELIDQGWDILQLAHYFGISNRLIVTSKSEGNSVTLEQLNAIYNAADVFYSTTVAEGWFLPLAEAMATKTPALVPNHSALAEWPNGAVHYINAPEIYASTMALNTIHYIPDRESTIAGLQSLYESSIYRKELADKGYKLITQDTFNWRIIAQQFKDIFSKV